MKFHIIVIFIDIVAALAALALPNVVEKLTVPLMINIERGTMSYSSISLAIVRVFPVVGWLSIVLFLIMLLNLICICFLIKRK